MRLLADEGVDAPIVHRLRADGCDVEYVAEVSPGLSDGEVLDRANHGERVLLTVDKDFGELVFRLGRVSHGVVLIRLAGLDAAHKSDLVSEAMRDHSDEMVGAFTVVTPMMIRIRPPL